MAKKTPSGRGKAPPDRGRPPSKRRPAPTKTPASGPPDDEDIFDPEQVELFAGIKRAMEDSKPLPLLEMVSAITLVMTQPVNPLDHDAPARPAMTYNELIESFMEVKTVETSAILAVVAAISPNEILQARIRRELVTRRHPIPGWLRNLDIAVTRTMRVTEPFGDGEDILVGLRLGQRHEATILVFVEHNIGSIVKDAYFSDQSMSIVESAILGTPEAEEMKFEDIEFAEARAKIEESIENGTHTWPPYETDTWPACRPLLEWVLATMPPGGEGWVRPEWSDRDKKRLIDDFFESPHGAPLDDKDHRDLLDSVIWFGTDYGPGDPLRWSVIAIEILLIDWIPRKIVAPVDYLDKAPGLLRGFVRYAHERRGLKPHLTKDVLAGIDTFAPEYAELIRTPRHQGPMAILERIGAVGPVGDDDFDDFASEFDESDLPTYMLERLTHAVGDRETLDDLDDLPLPDQPFDWSRVPADIHTRVDEVLVLVDGVTESHLGLEYRTACRRLLRDVAQGDPQIFRRKSLPARTAAAICWMVAKANEIVGYGRAVESQDLLAYFGVTGSVSQRTEAMQRAIGVNPYRQYGVMDLQATEYLVSVRRAQIIELRDHYVAQLAED